MSDPIQTICSLTGCTEQEANEAYDRTQDVIEAVDLLLAKPKTTPVNLKRPREITPEEEFMGPVRKLMKRIDDNISTSLNQHGHEGSVEMLDRREEKVPQSNCVPEYQPFSRQLEVQTLETAYPLRSGCFCDSQSSVQTSLYSDRECSQWIHPQGTVLSQTDEQTIVEVPLYEMSHCPPIEVDSEDQSHILLPESSRNYPEGLNQDSQQHHLPPSYSHNQN